MDKTNYDAQILDHYEDPYHCGPLEQSTHSAEGENQICGDSVRVELRMNAEEKIEEAWFQAEGCVLCHAASSMLMEKVEGMSREEVLAFSANDMLKQLSVPIAVNRQRCFLLSWRVLQDAIGASEMDDDDDDLHFGGPSLSEEC